MTAHSLHEFFKLCQEILFIRRLGMRFFLTDLINIKYSQFVAIM